MSEAPYSLFDRDASRIILPRQLPPAHGALLMLWLIVCCVDVRAPLSEVSSHSPPKLKSSASCAGRWILPVRPGIPGALYLPTDPAFRKGLRRQEKLCLFQPLRNGGDLAAAVGRYQQDAVQTGISRIIGRQFAIPEGGKYTVSIQGNVSSITYDEVNLTPVASSSGMIPGYQQIVNQRMADETRPSNATILCGIYLGCPAEV